MLGYHQSNAKSAVGLTISHFHHFSLGRGRFVSALSYSIVVRHAQRY